MNISKLATLANLPLSKDEAKNLDDQFTQTVDFIDHLKELNTKGVTETSQVTGKINQFRNDEIVPGLTQGQALQNATKTHGGFFVSKITWE